MTFKKIALSIGVTLLLGAICLPVMIDAQTPIKIGGNFELTGPAASYGNSMNQGIQLAIDELNTNEAVYSYVSYDNKSNKTEAATVAQKLIDEGVVGILGPATTGNALAEIPMAQEGAVPVILPAATGDGITLDPNNDSVLDYIFRVCFADSYQGLIGAQVASQQLKAKKAVLLVDQSSDYSQGLAATFKTEFEAQGGQIVAEESFNAGDTDFNAVLSNIAALDFDVLYAPCYYTEAGLIIRQARELALNQPILGCDGYDSLVLSELAGAGNLNNVFYTTHYSPLSQEADVQAFIKAYTDKFGTAPDTFAALAYDAAKLMAQAIDEAGSSDSTQITQALSQMKDFDGVTGTFSFDQAHNPVKSAILVEYQAGKVAQVSEVSAD